MNPNNPKLQAFLKRFTVPTPFRLRVLLAAALWLNVPLPAQLIFSRRYRR